EPIAEPAASPRAETPAPVPARARAAARIPSTIELGLAAVVAKLPRELLVGERPRIAERERISLPFAIIERQLGTGAVEVPSALFWSALPPLLKHHFVARDDIAVQLPLEEIFQNLPVAMAAEKPLFEPVAAFSKASPEPEAPIILAPAPRDEFTPELGLDLPPTAPAAIAPAAISTAPAPAAESPIKIPAPERAPELQTPAEPSPTAAHAPVLAPANSDAAAEEPATSLASAPPAGNEPAVVLQPFRVYAPPLPEIEAAPEPARAESVILETALAAGAPHAAASQILEPSKTPPPPADEPASKAPGVEVAEKETVNLSAAPVPATPAENSPPAFAVLPPPEPAALPPEPESAAAFTPDQPPPLHVEPPAAAVAVLRATVPPPQQSPVFASATISVQPPKIFRPVVLPPPITGENAAPAVNLAPTLGGPASAAAGMISLAPSAESNEAPRAAPAEPPQPAPPIPSTPPANEVTPDPPAAPASNPEAIPATVARAAFEPPPNPAVAPERESAEAPPESKPTLRDLARRLFSMPAPPVEPPSAAPAAENPPPPANQAPISPAEPSAPAAEDAPPPVAPAPPQPPAPTGGAALHLHLPPLPQAAAAPAAHHEPAPPALPLTRFDQHSLQCLFMTDETLDLPKISRLAAVLPGIQACIIATRGETFLGGTLPQGFDLATLRGLSPQVGAAADRLPIGELKNFTLYGVQYSVSFFERPSVSLCAVHRARSFVPGVREKLVAVVDELARS
ncbi:MAG TPA: hypothetical protein VEO95_05965, partial [Chthoniobacteraceae bacterium]|nr:hypothetical protein [Chthoniobacteraceae bacterium]